MKAQNSIENTGGGFADTQRGDAQASGGTTEKQATGKQFVAIIFILALATKMFLLPIFLIQATGRDAYIAMSIGSGIDLAALGVMLGAMYLNKSTDFFTLLSSVIGKIGARVAVGIIALFLFFKLNIAVSEILAFYGNNVFTDFDTSLMIVVLLVFFAAVGNHTLRALCRLNELVVPIVVLCLAILTAIVVITGFDLANIFPAMRAPETFRDGMFRHAAWLGDFTPLILFIGRTKLKKKTGFFAAGAGVIGSAVAVFFALVMSAAFGNVSVLVDTTTNLSSILQYSIGNVYGRIDMFSSILWSVSVFVEAALFFYATCRCIAFVVGKNAHFAIALSVTVCVYVLQIFAFIDPTVFSLIVTSAPAAVITTTLALAIPITALACAAVDRRKQYGGGEK
mgnify:CR=1 FL=1